jgi:hypothetical protein
MENKNVRNAFTHPVVSTYINLKTAKYFRIYFWNLLLFFLLFVTPFTGLFVTHFLWPATTSNETTSGAEWFWIFCCSFGLIFVIGREVFQFCLLEEKNLRRYLRKTTNWIEVLMILLASVVVSLIATKSSDLFGIPTSLFSAVLALIITTEFLCLIPTSSSQRYTMIIKNVFTSFPKFFLFFGTMLVPFSFCFCIIFRNKSEGEFFENFQGFWTSLFKLLLMLAGEYSIEIVKLDMFEMLFVSFFVMTTFWLFALIIGFSVDDIKELRGNAREKILQENAKKILHLGEFFFRIYRKFG